MNFETIKILLYDLVEEGDEKLANLLYGVGLEYASIHYTPSDEFIAEMEKRSEELRNGNDIGVSWEEMRERLAVNMTGKSSKNNTLYRFV